MYSLIIFIKGIFQDKNINNTIVYLKSYWLIIQPLFSLKLSFSLWNKVIFNKIVGILSADLKKNKKKTPHYFLMTQTTCIIKKSGLREMEDLNSTFLYSFPLPSYNITTNQYHRIQKCYTFNIGKVLCNQKDLTFQAHWPFAYNR